MPDLEILPGREQTEIGERGTNMSGGQKQRINIARALYSDSDIVLIDDALSALDAFVGKKVMEQVFCEEMAGKTRVMVTHHLSLLEGNVNKVILLADGKIIQCGSFEEVKKTNEYADFARGDKEDQSNSPGELVNPAQVKKELYNSPQKEKDKFSSNSIISEQRDQKEHGSDAYKHRLSGSNNLALVRSIEQEVEAIKQENTFNEQILKDGLAGKLTSEETRETGGVGLSQYSYYIK